MSEAQEKACQPIEDQLSAYHDEELSPKERQGVEQHLRACGRCESTLADLRRVSRQVRSAAAPEAPAGFRDRLMERIHADRGPPSRQIPLWIRYSAMGLAASLLVVLTLHLGGLIGGERRVMPEVALLRDSAPAAAMPPARGPDSISEGFVTNGKIAANPQSSGEDLAARLAGKPEGPVVQMKGRIKSGMAELNEESLVAAAEAAGPSTRGAAAPTVAPSEEAPPAPRHDAEIAAARQLGEQAPRSQMIVVTWSGGAQGRADLDRLIARSQVPAEPKTVTSGGRARQVGGAKADRELEEHRDEAKASDRPSLGVLHQRALEQEVVDITTSPQKYGEFILDLYKAEGVKIENDAILKALAELARSKNTYGFFKDFGSREDRDAFAQGEALDRSEADEEGDGLQAGAEKVADKAQARKVPTEKESGAGGAALERKGKRPVGDEPKPAAKRSARPSRRSEPVPTDARKFNDLKKALEQAEERIQLRVKIIE